MGGRDWVDTFMVWFFSIMLGGVAILLGWAIFMAMQGPWYGEGTVMGKEYHPPYTTISIIGKVPVTQYIPGCNWLKVVEPNGNEHDGCVSQRVWEDAMLGHYINITPQYH